MCAMNINCRYQFFPRRCEIHAKPDLFKHHAGKQPNLNRLNSTTIGRLFLLFLFSTHALALRYWQYDIVFQIAANVISTVDVCYIHIFSP